MWRGRPPSSEEDDYRYYESDSESDSESEEDYCESDDDDLEKGELSEKLVRRKGFRGRHRQGVSCVREKRQSKRLGKKKRRPSKRSGKKDHEPFKGKSSPTLVPKYVETSPGSGSGSCSDFRNHISHHIDTISVLRRKEKREKVLCIIASLIKDKLGIRPMGRVMDVSTIMSYIGGVHRDLSWLEPTNLQVMKDMVYEFMEVIEWSYNDNCGKASQYCYYHQIGAKIADNFSDLVTPDSVRHMYPSLEWMVGPLNSGLFIKNRVLHRLKAMYVIRELQGMCPGIDCFLPEFLKPVIGSPFGVCAMKYEFESPFRFTGSDAMYSSSLVVSFDEYRHRRILDAKVCQDEIDRMTWRLNKCRKSL